MPRYQREGAQFQNNKRGGFHQPPYNHQIVVQNSHDYDQIHYQDDLGRQKNQTTSFQDASDINRQYDDKRDDGTSAKNTYSQSRNPLRIQQHYPQQYKNPQSTQTYGGGFSSSYNNMQGHCASKMGGKMQYSAVNQARSVPSNQQQQLQTPPSQYPYQNAAQGGSIHYHRREVQDVFPYWQPLLKCDNASAEISAIQRELFSQAEKGELLIEIQIFINILQTSQEKALTNIKESECYDLIELAEEQGILHRTKRNFAKMKTLCFVSLQLDVISSECLLWVLRSLRRDEMSPTERAIQSRIKEAFAFKISQQQWDYMIDSIKQQGSSEISKNESGDTSLGASKLGRGLQTVMNSSKKGISVQTSKRSKRGQPAQVQYMDEPPMFKFSDIIEDQAIGSISRAIFLIDEPEWSGVDQNSGILETDVQIAGGLKALFNELIDFLEDYFCKNSEDLIQSMTKEEDKWCSSIENGLTRNVNSSQIHQRGAIPLNQAAPQQSMGTYEIDFEEVRAIPGGRYGCAQFVKICGPPNLHKCSLGRLAQLVQQAVKEDILRYHKTLLVWTTTVDKHKKKAAGDDTIFNKVQQNKEAPKKLSPTVTKLATVKQALIEILTENKQGMSLAQLPLYLRRKLQFSLDLNELGFPKLKDLILSMHDRIKLELRGHNHPFAYLIKDPPPPFTIQQKKRSEECLQEDAQIKRKQDQGITIIEWFIDQIDRLMINHDDGINQDQILEILFHKKSDSQFLGFQTLLDLVQKKVLPSQPSKDNNWILTVHSESNFFLRPSKKALTQNFSRSEMTSSQTNSFQEKQKIHAKIKEVLVHEKTYPPNAYGKDHHEKNSITVDQLSDHAIYDAKSQESNDSIASITNISQEVTRFGQSQAKTPSNQSVKNTFSPSNFTDQSHYGAGGAGFMGVLSPKSFQNISSDHLRINKPGYNFSLGNSNPVQYSIQPMNNFPVQDHSGQHNPNYQDNAYLQQNFAIQDLRSQQQQQQQFEDGTFIRQVWQPQQRTQPVPSFNNQQQLNQQLQQQQIRQSQAQATANKSYYPQYNQNPGFQGNLQPQIQSQMQHAWPQASSYQPMQPQARHQTGMMFTPDQVRIMNYQQQALPHAYSQQQHHMSSSTYNHSNQMLQASFENLRINNHSANSQQQELNALQYQAQQQVHYNQQLFKQQLPTFNQQLSSGNNSNSSNGLTSVNLQYQMPQTTSNSAQNDAQYMSNTTVNEGSQQTTSIFQISPNQKMKQMITLNNQLEDSAAFHQQSPFLPFDNNNDGNFSQFQHSQKVLVPHYPHGNYEQNNMMAVGSQIQNNMVARSEPHQQHHQNPNLSQQRQYQQQNIFYQTNQNEHKNTTQPNIQYKPVL